MYSNNSETISTSFIQSKWDSLLDTIGDDHFTLWVPVSMIYTFSLYWLLGSIFIFMDLTNKPAFMRKYKIQTGTHEPLDFSTLFKV